VQIIGKELIMKTTVRNEIVFVSMPVPCLSAVPGPGARSAPAGKHDDVPLSGMRSPVITRAIGEAGSTLYELLGMAELIRVAYEKGELASAQNRLEILQKDAAALSSAFSTILEFIRLDPKGADAICQRFDIVALLHEVSHTARTLVQGKPIRVMDAACATPVVINADPGKIRQIMMGLVSNAAKFTDRGRIALILSKESEEIRLTVVDTGRGMAQEEIDTVLDPSNHGYDAEVNPLASSGLGLRMVKALVKQLQGSFSLASKTGEGTIATVSLPLQRLQ
jgi:signal transduction histidine kinase